MQILVTGGAGFIGAHLALRLEQLGHRVSVVDNFDPYYSPALKHQNAKLLSDKRILVHQLDLAIDPLEGILEGVEAVIHLAGQPGISASTPYSTYLKNNTYATVALLEAVRGKGIKFINVATSSVYGANAMGDENTLPAPISPYGVTKLAAEQAVLSEVRRKSLEACSLRYFSVYGPRERPDKVFPKIFSALIHDTPFTLFEGSEHHQRSYSYVGDIVEGTILALTKWEVAKGEVFNIGTDLSFTTGQALEIAQRLTGKKLIIKTLPARAGDQSATHANIAKARAKLGYEPKYTLEQGLAEVWNWAKVALK